MATATSKLTSKYQATIPEPVRKVLHLKAGDAIAFDIEGCQILLRKARPLDIEIQDLDSAGLPSPSVIRMKLFTLDEKLIIRKAGKLARPDQDKIIAALRQLLPFVSEGK